MLITEGAKLRERYISVRTLLDYCDNATDHCVTANDIMRMHYYRAKDIRVPCKPETINALADMMDYFTGCKGNAQPGSAAEKRYSLYTEALQEAVDKLKAEPEEGGEVE